MKDRTIGKVLLTLQLILLYQIPWHIKLSFAEAEPVLSLRVADYARGSLKNRFQSICDHPVHEWMCSTSLGKSLFGNQNLIAVGNNQDKISFTTPKSVTPSTLVVTLPPHYLARTVASIFRKSPALSELNNVGSLPPQYTSSVESNYDLCQHPFHAWLCDKSNLNVTPELSLSDLNSRDQSTDVALVTTNGTQATTLLLNTGYFSKTINERSDKKEEEQPLKLRSQLQLNDLQIKTSASQIAAKEYNSCDHPFHSWLCKNNTRTKSAFNQNLIISSHKQPKSTNRLLRNHDIKLHPQTSNNITSKTNGKSCNHTFHSWLCHSRVSITVAPRFDKSLLPENPKEIPTSLSNNQEVPFNINLPLNNLNHNCNHAFHAWLCPNKFQKTTTEPVTTTTPTAKLSKNLFIQSSTNFTTPTPTPHEPTANADYNKCSHAFHSWICSKSSQRSQTKIIGTTVSPRIDKNMTTKSSTKAPILQQSQKLASNIKLAPKTFSPSCNHAFHSWLCPKPLPKVHAESIATSPSPKLSKNLIPGDTNNAVTQSSNIFKSTLNPQTAIPKDYHKCNHAFHSWLCAAPSRQSITPKPITTTSAPNLSKSLFSIGSNNFVTNAPNPIKQTSNVSTTIPNEYHKCNHAFHSWLCSAPSRKSTTPKLITTTSAPNLGKSLFSISSINFVTNAPNPKKQTSNVPTTIPNDYHKCNHAFHSWLCAAPSRKSTTPKPIATTLAPKLSKILLSKSLNNFVTNAPNLIKQTSNVPKTISNDYHKCNHAFHSWLCQAPSRQSTTPNPVNSTQTPKLNKSLFSKSSNIFVTKAPNLIKSISNVTTAVSNDYYKCNHAFHSWLCATSIKRLASTRNPIDTTPVPILAKSLIPQNILENSGKDTQIISPVIANKHICIHASHSWLCQEPFKPKKLPTVRRKLVSEIKQSESKNNDLGFQDLFDCQDPDAFSHPSFNNRCNVEPKTTSSLSTTTAAPITFTAPTTSTASTTISTGRIITTSDKIITGAKSFDSSFGSNFFKLSTQTTTPSSIIPQVNNKLHSWNGADPCSHAFHAWLCQPLRPKLTQPPFSPPRHSPNFVLESIRKSNKSLIPLKTKITFWPTLLTTSKPKKQDLSSPSSYADNLEKTTDDACSNSFDSPLCNKVPVRFTANTTTVAVPETPTKISNIGKSFSRGQSSNALVTDKTSDPCSHPFHSWLCFTFDNKHSKLNLDQIPNIRSLPLENENPKVKWDDSARNVRRIKTSDYSFVGSKSDLNDSVADATFILTRNTNDGEEQLQRTNVRSYEATPSVLEVVEENDQIDKSELTRYFEEDPPLHNTEEHQRFRFQTINKNDGLEHGKINIVLLKNSNSHINSARSSSDLYIAPRVSDLNSSPSSSNLNSSPISTILKEKIINRSVIDISALKNSPRKLQKAPPNPSLTKIISDIPGYDWTDPLFFESKRTIPRKMNI